jgi:hypothetical protein
MIEKKNTRFFGGFLLKSLSLKFLPVFLFSFVSMSLAIPIDTFEASQSLEAIASSTGSTANNVLTTTTALGGTRSLLISATSPLPRVLEVRIGQGTREISHSQAAQVTGSSEIIWDGDALPALNTTGLGGMDLLSDNADAFELGVSSFDFPFQRSISIVVKVYSNIPNATFASQGVVTISRGVSGEVLPLTVPFSQMQQIPGTQGPADFRNVGAVSLEINGVNSSDADVVINLFKTNGICQDFPQSLKFVDECGVCNGPGASECGCDRTVIKDLCGVCGGNDSSCADCRGVPNGGVVIDQCGVCGGDNTTCRDCLGVPNGGAIFDQCGVCGGDNSTCADCSGVPNGTKVRDLCGVCGGDNTTCRDCVGTPNGSRRVGTQCQTTLSGSCSIGRYNNTCECIVNTSGQEICDKIDNDCDAQVDEGIDCSVAGLCISGVVEPTYKPLQRFGRKERVYVNQLIFRNFYRILGDNVTRSSFSNRNDELQKELKTLVDSLPKDTTTYSGACLCSKNTYVDKFEGIKDINRRWYSLVSELVELVRNKRSGGECEGTPEECIARIFARKALFRSTKSKFDRILRSRERLLETLPSEVETCS